MRNPIKSSSVVALILFALFAAGCIPDSPEAPEWELGLYIPILDETWILWDELSGDEFYIDSLSYDLPVVAFSLEEQLDPIDILDYIEFKNSEPDTHSYQLSEFDINMSDDKLLVEFPLSDIWEDASLLHGQSTVIPDLGIVEISDPQPHSFDDYRWVDILKGSFTVDATNNLPIPAESVELSIIDSDSNYIPDFSLGPLDPLSFSSSSNSMDNTSITNTLYLNLDIASSGSGGVPVVIDSAASILFELYFEPGLNLSEAELKAKRFESTIDTTFTIEIDSLQVVELILNSGILGVEIQNQLSLPLDIEFELPDLEKEGLPLSNSGTIPEFSSSLFESDLDGVSFSPASPPPGLFDYDVSAVITVKSALADPDSFVIIGSADGMTAMIEMKDLELSYFEGEVLSTTEFDDERFGTGIDEEFPDYEMEFLDFDLVMDNESGFSPTASFTMSALDQFGSILDSADLPSFDIPAHDSASVLHLVNHQGVLGVINSRPDTILFSGSISGGEGSVSQGDEIDVMVKLKTPFVFSMEEEIIEPELSEDITLDEDARADIEDYAVELRAYLSITSHLPLGTEIYFAFDSDSESVKIDPDLRLPSEGAYSIESGLLELIEDGGLEGKYRVIEPSETLLEIGLDQEDFLILTEDSLYLWYSIVISGTSGKTVIVEPDNYISVSIHGEGKGRIPFGD